MTNAIDVNEAVARAKGYVLQLYAGEDVTNLGLEEVEYDTETNCWLITVAFSRPWNSPRTRAQEALEKLGSYANLRRSYKIISISDEGQVRSMKNRPRAEVE